MNAKPTRKVGAGGLGGGLAVVLVWAITEFWGVEVPAEVAAAVAAICGSLASYLTPDRK